jgi:hypothetical protein
LRAGTIALERVLAVERHESAANLRYTYRFEPNTWMRQPDALRVFPWVAQLNAGQRSAVLEQRFAHRDGAWVALGPSE